MPEHPEYIIQRTKGVDCFQCASNAERLPSEVAIKEQMEKFKALRFKQPGATS